MSAQPQAQPKAQQVTIPSPRPSLSLEYECCDTWKRAKRECPSRLLTSTQWAQTISSRTRHVCSTALSATRTIRM